MRVAPHTVSSLPVMRAFPRFSGSLGCVLVLTWLPACMQVANTFSTSTWKTEDQLFEDVRGLQASGFSVYVLFHCRGKHDEGGLLALTSSVVTSVLPERFFAVIRCRRASSFSAPPAHLAHPVRLAMRGLRGSVVEQPHQMRRRRGASATSLLGSGIHPQPHRTSGCRWKKERLTLRASQWPSWPHARRIP